MYGAAQRLLGRLEPVARAETDASVVFDAGNGSLGRGKPVGTDTGQSRFSVAGRVVGICDGLIAVLVYGTPFHLKHSEYAKFSYTNRIT